MQYESLLLDALSRLQALEKEVAELKKQLSAAPALTPHMLGGAFEPTPSTHDAKPSRTNTRVTEEMLDACYRAGQKSVAADTDVFLLAEQVSDQTGMNKNNAVMTIFAVMALLNGELYKRGISAKATAKYFEHILRDYGKGGLQRAIAAMRMHIDYRRTLHHNVDRLEMVCDEYQKMI